MDSASVAATTPVATEAHQAGAACPFPHGMVPAAIGCPVPHGAAAGGAIDRSRADERVRKLLRIHDRPARVSESSANKAFQTSMLISATRCTLTYVIFPIVIPLLGILKGVQAPLGITIGTFAIVCDTFTIRRFFAADHKYRWYFSAIALSIIGLLFVLLAEDIVALFG